jgi:hypothetical protein
MNQTAMITAALHQVGAAAVAALCIILLHSSGFASTSLKPTLVDDLDCNSDGAEKVDVDGVDVWRLSCTGTCLTCPTEQDNSDLRNGSDSIGDFKYCGCAGINGGLLCCDTVLRTGDVPGKAGSCTPCPVGGGVRIVLPG